MSELLDQRPSAFRKYFPYVILILLFSVGIWLVLAFGSRLNTNERVARISEYSSATSPATERSNSETRSTSAGRAFWENFRSPLSILLLQVVVIILISRIFRILFRKIGQPPVMGEMVAGIFLGPSVLGLISPDAMAFLFPASSMETLRLLSQIGVVLFMFVVGMELNVGHLREKGSAALMISHASIIVPFLLGTLLAVVLFPTLAPRGISFNGFALFIGVAMSITAFPVLARILEDRGIAKTYLGTMALTCAAVDDVTAWCLLALVIAIVKSSGIASAIVTVGLVACFTCLMIFLIRPRLGHLIKDRLHNEGHNRGLIAGTLAFVLVSALVTEIIGIHALFGAFLAGVSMPLVPGFRLFLKEKLESFSSSALLPLFFAFTGLRTQIALLNDWSGWFLCLMIIGVAITGKLGGSALMARWTGLNWQDSLSLGVLMNARGLVELVVLNIGYDLGILSERVFAMLVIMALATTFMTGPLLSLTLFRKREPAPLSP
jgi:Kef-type K+ transport system membrane component KefB